jgi:hypothetical protein
VNERELRTKVAKRRQRSRGEKENDVSDSLWDYLVDMGFVGEALDTQDDLAVDYLLRQIDRMMDAMPDSARQGGFRPTGRDRGKVFAPQLSPRNLERAELFGDYLAMVAANTPEVRAFREAVLGGQMLNEEQAYAFLSSPVTRCCSLTFLSAWEVPPVGHTFAVDEKELEREDAWTRGFPISIDPPGITKTIRLSGDTKRYLPLLTFPSKEVRGGKRHAEHVTVAVGSVLDDLRRVSESLEEWYPWELADATWLVLTGQPPPVPPARGSYRIRRGSHYAYGQITITAMPWVPAETVFELYRKAQLHARGGVNQPIREKTIKLMRFIIDRVYLELGVYSLDLSEGERKSLGKRLVAEWNQTEWVQKNPKWAYGKGDTRTFWRDFNRALQTLANQKRNWQQ